MRLPSSCGQLHLSSTLPSCSLERHSIHRRGRRRHGQPRHLCRHGRRRRPMAILVILVVVADMKDDGDRWQPRRCQQHRHGENENDWRQRQWRQRQWQQRRRQRYWRQRHGDNINGDNDTTDSDGDNGTGNNGDGGCMEIPRGPSEEQATMTVVTTAATMATSANAMANGDKQMARRQAQPSLFIPRPRSMMVMCVAWWPPKKSRDPCTSDQACVFIAACCYAYSI